jgi:hypothetical protein
MGCAGFAGLAAGLLLAAFDPSLLPWCWRPILRISLGLAALAGIALLATLGQALAR